MRRIAVRAIIADGDKLLLVKLKSDNKPMDFYCTIGGGLDEGEDLLSGLRREIIEETGIEPEIGKLLCIQQYADSKDNLEFFFHVTNADDFKDINLTKTSHGSQEIYEIGFMNPKECKILPSFLSEHSLEELLTSEQVVLLNYL
jgi:ADP-ribose pyrophosphatase YjhB (NUDIX family)